MVTEGVPYKKLVLHTLASPFFAQTMRQGYSMSMIKGDDGTATGLWFG